MSDFRMRIDKPSNKHVHRTHSGGGFNGIDLSTPPPKPVDEPIEPPKTHHALATAQVDEAPPVQTIVTDDLTGSEAIVKSDGGELPKVISLPPPKRPATIKKHEAAEKAPTTIMPKPEEVKIIAEPPKQEVLPEAVVSLPSETSTTSETEESDNE